MSVSTTRAAFVIALVVALGGLFYTLQRIDDIDVKTAASDTKLPRYTLGDAVLTRYDAEGTPALRATAKTLEYFDDESARAETLQLDVLSGVNMPWRITAPSGVMPAGSRKFLLEGDVLAKGNWPDNAEPMTVNTKQLWVDPDQHELTTDRSLTFQSVTRDGSAIGMHSNWIDKDLQLLKDVKMRYDQTH